MAQYRKKTLTDAMEWTGDNFNVILDWACSLGADVRSIERNGSLLMIHTLEGTMTAQVHDHIMCGQARELYPCKPDVLQATYELV